MLSANRGLSLPSRATAAWAERPAPRGKEVLRAPALSSPAPQTGVRRQPRFRPRLPSAAELAERTVTSVNVERLLGPFS